MANKKIFILNDEQTLREMIENSYLISEDTVYSAADVKSAWDLVSKINNNNETLDAALFDMSLSGSELAEFLLYLRNIFPSIGFVCLSSYLSEDIIDRVRLLGANEYISKPFDPDDLHKLVENAIKKKENDINEKISLDQPRILIVDDDEVVKDVLSNTLLIEQYEVDSVSSVHEALKKFEQNYYHIVITDLMMANINGMELTSALRLMDADTVIIIITGYPNIESTREALKHNVQDYLTKPVDPEDLIRVIKNAWEKQRLKWLTQRQKKELENAFNEIKEAQKQVIHSAKMAAIGDLSAGIAHELNQPLHGLRIIISSLKRDINKNRLDLDMLPADLDEAEGYIARMANIIDHLRIYTRFPDQNELLFTDVNKAIQNALNLFGSQLNNKNIRLEISLYDNLPKIKAIPQELEQVFINLITNARDAFESGKDIDEKNIEIKTFVQESENNIVISITDNAGGVPEEIRDKIFNPFFTTKSSGKGTGLGLSIASKIIERFGGEFELIVNAPKSIFLIIFPYN